MQDGGAVELPALGSDVAAAPTAGGGFKFRAFHFVRGGGKVQVKARENAGEDEQCTG